MFGATALAASDSGSLPPLTGCYVRRTSNQITPAGSEFKMIAQSAVYDTSGFWSASEPDRITIPASVKAGSAVRFHVLISVENKPGNFSGSIRSSDGTWLTFSPSFRTYEDSPWSLEFQGPPCRVSPGQQYSLFLYSDYGRALYPATSWGLTVIGVA